MGFPATRNTPTLLLQLVPALLAAPIGVLLLREVGESLLIMTPLLLIVS